MAEGEDRTGIDGTQIVWGNPNAEFAVGDECAVPRGAGGFTLAKILKSVESGTPVGCISETCSEVKHKISGFQIKVRFIA